MTTKEHDDLARVDGVPSDRALGSTASDNRLLRCVRAWADARGLRLAEKHRMEAYTCEYSERADWEAGDCGVERCYRANLPFDERCDSCQARDPHFQRMVQLRSIEKTYWRGLCSLVDRRAKARTADAVDPVLSNSHGPSTRDKNSSVMAPLTTTPDEPQP